MSQELEESTFHFGSVNTASGNTFDLKVVVVFRDGRFTLRAIRDGKGGTFEELPQRVMEKLLTQSLKEIVFEYYTQ